MPKYILILIFFSVPFLATSQTADFTFQSSNGLFCNPSTIRFTQNCTGNPIGFVWDFGNNTKGYSGDISVDYTNAGIFTVKLTAIYDVATLEVSKTVIINPAVTASIGFDKNYICKPGIINFNAITNSNISTYSWNFGDLPGNVNTAASNIVHNYANFGSYPVTLKATDNAGCVGLANTTINVNKPPILATASPTSGCVPANVNFNANVNVPVNDFVSNYNWSFGDGSPLFSTPTNNLNHSYTAAGSYSATLNITTNNGCTNAYNFPVMAYGTPPINLIAYTKKTIVCASETPVFVSKATNANSYFWDFGDGSTASVSDTITQHKYTTLGNKTVTVTPFFNGCQGTTLGFNINIVGVFASYTYSNTCTSKKTYSFNNTSQGNLSGILWNFGDNSPTLSTLNAANNFPVPGQFITSLTVTDAITGCADTCSQTIYSADPMLLNPDTSICRNTNTSFSIINNYTGPAAYTWNIAGTILGPTANPAITVKAGSFGNFNNFVSINYGSQSCPDTVQLNHPILVKGPDLNFNAPSPICLKALSVVTNNSKPFVAADLIVRSYWNFGNTLVNDTIYQPLPFQYKNPGSYNITLTGIDINGCKDSLTKIIVVNPLPFLRVIPHLDTLCLGQTDSLTAFSSGNILWSPANNISCNNCDTIVANPVVTTKYYITATTLLNCSINDSILVNVYTPFTATTPSNILYICQNEQVQLDIEPKGKKIAWSPATGLSNATIYNPVVSPLQNTVYTATLTDSVGCFSSSVTINEIVKSVPTVDAGPNKIVPYNSTFTITPVYGNNISLYAWTPTTLLNCDDCAIPTGTALALETYTIKVTSDSGCIARDSITIFVECKNAYILMPKAFTPNNDNLNDYYYPITRGIKSIIKFAIFDRQGKIMYEVKNFLPNSKAFGWNGEFKGQYQPAAAYVYLLEALCDVGEKITKSGSFLLLR